MRMWCKMQSTIGWEETMSREAQTILVEISWYVIITYGPCNPPSDGRRQWVEKHKTIILKDSFRHNWMKARAYLKKFSSDVIPKFICCIWYTWCLVPGNSATSLIHTTMTETATTYRESATKTTICYPQWTTHSTINPWRAGFQNRSLRIIQVDRNQVPMPLTAAPGAGVCLNAHCEVEEGSSMAYPFKICISLL